MPKKLGDVFVLKLSLMLVVTVTHYLTTFPSSSTGVLGAETESALGRFSPFLIPCSASHIAFQQMDNDSVTGGAHFCPQKQHLG